MFGSKNNSKPQSRIDSLIGGQTELQGDVRFTGGLHVDGVIKGNVLATGDGSSLSVSEHGRIEGEVRVHNIVLNGQVTGNVYAFRHIELAPKARVTGNVYYNLIEMAMGAEVNGNLVHQAQERTEERTDQPESQHQGQS